jgi:hypothetical protein
MKKLIKVSILVVLVTVACLCKGERASAAANSFTCSSNFYQVISGQLKLLNPLTGVYTNIGSNAGFIYNAIGYNPLDNYIYGVATSGSQTGDLFRIDNNGIASDLGLPSGLPGTGFDNGSFDLAGNLYIRTSVDNHTIYRINVGANQNDASTMTVTALNITGAGGIVSGADNVFINNKLYTLDGNSLSIIDLSNDTVTTVSVNGPTGWLNAGTGFGAGWTDQAGELFFSNNGSGFIYQISDFDSPSPTASFKVTGTVTSNNDGTSCLLASQSPFDPPIAANDSYTTLSNTPLNETITPLLSNDVGNSLTVTSNTSPTHGTISINSDGTFLYTPNHGFSGTDSFDYTVTDSFGRTASATVTITVPAASSAAKTVPETPDTGYGAPSHSSPVILVLTSLALFSIGGGLLLLYRLKLENARRYHRLVLNKASEDY